MVDIIRDMDKSDRAFIDIPIADMGGKIVTPQDRLSERISIEMNNANKEGRPFCEVAALAEVKERSDKAMQQFKRQGFIDDSTRNNLMLDSVDWKKFSDLKNFEVTDKGQTRDEHLSKIHRLPVFVEWTKYKYKGFSNTITMMESEESAVDRAQKKMRLAQETEIKKGK